MSASILLFWISFITQQIYFYLYSHCHENFIAFKKEGKLTYVLLQKKCLKFVKHQYTWYISHFSPGGKAR